MLQISEEDILRRLHFDNPWWVAGGRVDKLYREFPARDYLPPFLDLVSANDVRRAVVLLGPRRVGKTVMLYQMIDRFLAEGTVGTRILFLSLETPIYSGLSLESLLQRYLRGFEHERGDPLLVVFDEIQYLKDWEVHLKSLVDSFPGIRFVVSGSAAAALRLKGRESGAGRFTEFLLPPLTFSEYLRFLDRESDLIANIDAEQPTIRDISALNDEFIQYLNFGGYPEAVFNRRVRLEGARYVKSDIIDKVLLRDLPQLYGIQDIQELNRLFNTLAYNTGNEVSLEELSKTSGVSKNTLKRYLEYLEAAFLVRRVHRIDQNARRFQRATAFKVYLTNPTMRAALFGQLRETDQAMGALAETAVFSQWFHDEDSMDTIHYARWDKGEIDIVSLDPATQKPSWAVEVKWSDKAVHDRARLRHVLWFSGRNPTMDRPLVTTKRIREHRSIDGIPVEFVPTSFYTWQLGRTIVRRSPAGDPFRQPDLPFDPPENEDSSS